MYTLYKEKGHQASRSIFDVRLMMTVYEPEQAAREVLGEGQTHSSSLPPQNCLHTVCPAFTRTALRIKGPDVSAPLLVSNCHDGVNTGSKGTPDTCLSHRHILSGRFHRAL